MKREAGVQHGHDLADFPPRTAGASLKPVVEPQLARHRRALSPANCGGLIEAGANPCHKGVAGATFPRELRGPH